MIRIDDNQRPRTSGKLGAWSCAAVSHAPVSTAMPSYRSSLPEGLPVGHPCGRTSNGRFGLIHPGVT